MSFTSFQKQALRDAVRSTLVDRLRLLGFESNEVSEGLWILHNSGSWGAAGTKALEVDLFIGNLIELIDRKIGERDG